MVINIISPEYWISELFGDVLIFGLFLAVLILVITTRKKLPFQIVASIFILSFLMLGIVMPGFASWIPLMIIIIGILGGTIFYRFIDRT